MSSIIQYYGKSEKGRCGYCRSGSAISYSFHAYQLLPIDYQSLVDRGWRRSGHYTYKPKNSTTCCPCYTIRCDCKQFKLSKSHKKILKRMNKFLKDGIRPEKNTENLAKEADDSFQEIVDIPQIKKAQINLDDIKGDGEELSSFPIPETPYLPVKAPVCNTSQSSSTYTNPPRKKAKQMRIERKKAKLEAKGENWKPKHKTIAEKTIREFVDDVDENDCHKLKVILVQSINSITQEVFELYKKYQIIVHRDPPEKPTFKQFERFLVKSPLKLKIVDVKSEEFKESLNQSYDLYEKYQNIIHNEPETKDDFLEFLVNSPLKTTINQSSPSHGFGSFHQQYWLDDKLIAVGVLDVLPHCVSSVYFFYDPDYSFLSLGTYSSLRELEFTQQLSEVIPSLKYYYMGFYIHNCPKMRYKGNLSSSYLLCPESYTWINLDNDLRNLLDIAKYQRLNRDPEAVDVNEFTESNDLDGVLVLSENRYCTYKTYIQSFNIDTLDNLLDMVRSRIYEEVTGDNDERSSIIEYGKLVGKPCAHRMLYLIVPD